jgi:hypothetical protein
MPRRDYKNAQGEKLQGVTTHINVLAKPALVGWAFKQGQAYERGEIGGLYESRDKAGDAGTLSHEMVECYLKGQETPPLDGIAPDVLDKAEGCYQAFIGWQERQSFEMVESEIPLVSEEHQFGGTIDIVGRVGGELAIVDIKTSKGIFFSMKVQVAAYGRLWNENRAEKIGEYHILRLGPGGEFEHHFFPSLDDEWRVFLACLEINRILRATGQKL